jgi:hypothetical protein
LNEPIEKFCFVKFEETNLVLVANGNLISLIELVESEDGTTLKLLSNVHVFQKPIMSITYDRTRKRVIVGGLDQQIKFFEIFNEASANQNEGDQTIED